MPDKEELRRLQSLSLDDKVTLTKLRITEWYEHYDGAVYISFSGGKDSSVLLEIARQVYPDMPAVYCDTGLEFPEVKAHVKSLPNVTIIRPTKTFKEVIDEYGWVYPSKDVAFTLRYAKKGSEWAKQRLDGLRKDGTPSQFRQRMYTRWKPLLDAPFKISNQCCEIMKERPIHAYEKSTGTHGIVATMADESIRRKQSWERTGCNAFDAKFPVSKPMSFWTEDDVLQYISLNNIAIPSVYGDIVKQRGHWRTTGEKRTGCMFCLIGCHLDKDNKFQRMHRTHPKIYDYCMDKLGMREILDYIGVPY